jgi:hypothetical protein
MRERLTQQLGLLELIAEPCMECGAGKAAHLR